MCIYACMHTYVHTHTYEQMHRMQMPIEGLLQRERERGERERVKRGLRSLPGPYHDGVALALSLKRKRGGPVLTIFFTSLAPPKSLNSKI